MQIRPAVDSDLAAAAELWYERVALLQQTDTCIRPLPDARAVWKARAKAWIDAEESAMFVAEKDGRIVGFIALTIGDGRPGLQPKRLGIVMDMAVELHQAYLDLSGSLLEAGQSWLRTKQIAKMEIPASARYPVEEAFWRSRGAKLQSNRYWLST